jgi:hypothetical protein
MFKTLFRDLLGSPLDQWQRESIFINENDNNRKIEQQEKRLCEMNEIANRQARDHLLHRPHHLHHLIHHQLIPIHLFFNHPLPLHLHPLQLLQAKDIQELRAAAERSVESAVEISRCSMEQRPREMSIRSDMRSPAANGAGEQWRSALQDATEQQQLAISRGQQELRDLA